MIRLCGCLRYAPEAAQLCRAIVSTPASNRLVCLAPRNRIFIDSSGSRCHHTIPTAVALFCSPPSTHHRVHRGHRIDHHHLCCGSDDDGRVRHLLHHSCRLRRAAHASGPQNPARSATVDSGHQSSRTATRFISASNNIMQGPQDGATCSLAATRSSADVSRRSSSPTCERASCANLLPVGSLC